MTQSAISQIILASRPEGRPVPRNFHLEKVPMPAIPPKGVLLRVLYLSLDPYMRGRMDDRKSYAKPVAIGEFMPGESVAEGIATDHPGMSKGISYWQRRDGGRTPLSTVRDCASSILRWRR